MDDHVIQAEQRLAIVQKSAAKRGYDVSLTLDNVKNLLSATTCVYTGVVFDRENALSFDRVDNTKGYHPGNVIPVTVRSNQLKSDFDLNALKKQAKILPNKHLGLLGSVNAKEKAKIKKIDHRRIMIEEQQRLIKIDEAELALIEAEKVEAQNIINYDRESAGILLQVITKIESGEAMAAAQTYCTTRQTINAKFKTFISRITNGWL